MSASKIGGEYIPPHNLEAEAGVLGSMLLDSYAIARAIETKIDAESFYKPPHRVIFRAILDLFNKNEAVDIVTLTNKLRNMGKLEEVGGPVYITDLINSVPSAAHIEDYARIVVDKAALRSLISTARSITSESYDNPEDVGDFLDRAEQKIFEISQRKIESCFQRIGDGLIKDAIETAEKIHKQGGLLMGVPSGFPDLDRKTAGFQPSDLIILAGRPSMGKTAIALNIAEHLGVEEKVPVAIFSLEMSKEALVMRMLCSHAQVSSHKVRSGYLDEKVDFAKLVSTAGKMAQAPIYIDDSAGISVLEMRAKARRLVSKEGIRLIILDYLQLMGSPAMRRSENRQQEISDISRSIKALARELRIPIMVLSQLNRGPETRPDHRPLLSDLRESGALEQDADLVLFLYREEVYERDNPEIFGKAELIIGKQRNGPIGKVDLTFIQDFTRFECYSARQEVGSISEAEQEPPF